MSARSPRTFEPPRFTPADRFAARDVVANVARAQLAEKDDGAWILATDALAAAVAKLDEIDAYLGVPRAVSA